METTREFCVLRAHNAKVSGVLAEVLVASNIASGSVREVADPNSWLWEWTWLRLFVLQFAGAIVVIAIV